MADGHLGGGFLVREIDQVIADRVVETDLAREKQLGDGDSSERLVDRAQVEAGIGSIRSLPFTAREAPGASVDGLAVPGDQNRAREALVALQFLEVGLESADDLLAGRARLDPEVGQIRWLLMCAAGLERQAVDLVAALGGEVEAKGDRHADRTLGLDDQVAGLVEGDVRDLEPGMTQKLLGESCPPFDRPSFEQLVAEVGFEVADRVVDVAGGDAFDEAYGGPLLGGLVSE